MEFELSTKELIYEAIYNVNTMIDELRNNPCDTLDKENNLIFDYELDGMSKNIANFTKGDIDSYDSFYLNEYLKALNNYLKILSSKKHVYITNYDKEEIKTR